MKPALVILTGLFICSTALADAKTSFNQLKMQHEMQKSAEASLLGETMGQARTKEYRLAELETWKYLTSKLNGSHPEIVALDFEHILWESQDLFAGDTFRILSEAFGQTMILGKVPAKDVRAFVTYQTGYVESEAVACEIRKLTFRSLISSRDLENCRAGLCFGALGVPVTHLSEISQDPGAGPFVTMLYDCFDKTSYERVQSPSVSRWGREVAGPGHGLEYYRSYLAQ